MTASAARKKEHRERRANRAKWELKLGDRLNLSSYVGVDPINFTDPLGLCAGNQVFVRTGGSSVGGNNGTDIGVTVSGYCMDWSSIFPPTTIARTPEPGRGGSGGRAPAPAQRTQSPTPCQKSFLKDQLANRGLPTSQIDSLRFVSGLDASANALTRRAFNGGASAVTQGSTVYVQSSDFGTVANFQSTTGFEEAYHTAQFASDSAFYSTYGILSIGGLFAMGDSYKGNLYEAFAKGAAKQMFEAAKAGMCP